MLRKLRIILAIISFITITLLFVDFSGSTLSWSNWLAKLQFFPSVIALNIVFVGILIVLTLIFGRVYCSVACPLGIFQDFISWLTSRKKRNRFSFHAAYKKLRYTGLAVFILSAIGGISAIVALLEPYSAFGRMATYLLAPAYRWGNNLLAYLAEQADSYAFYSVDIWLSSVQVFAVALLTFIFLLILAWKSGRLYCNTICPVGTFLGLISNYSLLKPRINEEKCNHCGLCERNCKASCINAKTGEIDYSRCISCFDCIERCPQSSIKFSTTATLRAEENNQTTENKLSNNSENSRRNFLTVSALFALGSARKAFAKKFDGGLALIEGKKAPERSTDIVPPGALSIANFRKHCTGCTLCVSACPNHVLRPSSDLQSFMQPEMSYEQGYCRPECTRCSEVCPAGAIIKINTAEKSAIQIGHAVWNKDLCIVNRDKVSCNNCARHCPTGAISMVAQDPNNPMSLKIPVVDEGRCIGCGACENLCPARPYSAIHVEGHERHKII
jgi:polyferredoxin